MIYPAASFLPGRAVSRMIAKEDRLTPAIVARAIERAFDGEPFAAIRDLVSQVVEFDDSASWCFVNYGRPEHLFDTIGSPGRTALYEDLIASVYKISPYFNAVVAPRAPDGFYPLREAAPDDFTSTTYYEVYYRNKGVADEGMFFVNCPRGGLTFTIERNTPSRPFDEDDLFALRQMTPLVRALLRKEATARPSTPEPGSSAPNFLAAHNLSKREHEVAALLLQGHSSKSAARVLGISPHTERVHRKRLYRRLGVTSHIELFRLFSGQITRETLDS